MTALPCPTSSAFDWRKRAQDLFDEANAAKNPLSREATRRKATAALNIAESMEHSAEIAALWDPAIRPSLRRS
jgi:hypothetical protein